MNTYLYPRNLPNPPPPEPTPELQERYLSTLASDKEREAAKKIIKDYSSQRLITFRTTTL